LIFNGADANGATKHAARMAAALDAVGVDVEVVSDRNLGHFDWLEWSNPGPEAVRFFEHYFQPAT
jgi:hypothetical protein